MIEFGKSLRLAREAKGYTVARLAELTRLAPSLVSDLENEDFRQIAAPIYGRGFVKLYCEAVGLETKAFVDEFMEIFNGNREPRIKERPLPGSGPTAAPVRSEPADPAIGETPIPTPPPMQDLFQTPPTETPVATAVPEPTAAAPGAAVAPGAAEAFGDRPLLSRYSTNFRTIRAVTPAVWRMGALALVAAVVLTAVFMGLRALRRATMPADRNGAGAPDAAEIAETAPGKPAAPETATAARTPRTPQAVAPLYID
ncbi:MAG: helix-turn-helix domain-containing protein [Kiritimatiellia bacterium]